MRLFHILAETGWSGGEVQLDHLVRHLHSRGHEQHLLLERGAAFGAVAEELGLTLHTARLRRGHRPTVQRTIRALVGQVAPEVLHFGCGRSLLWGGWACRGLDVPLRYTTRRIDYPIGRSRWRGGRYRSLVDHVIANCRSVRQRVLDAGVPEDRVTLLHEGIDMAPWVALETGDPQARQALGIDPGAIVVSCAATLRPRKGQGNLIDAFARVAPRHPTAVLVLAGAGPDLERLRKKAAAVPDRVLVPGPIQPVADLYRASDLFLMPSFHEGLSNACLEASAAGLPLIVSSVGGLPEIVADGETGAVVPPGDVDALAAALDRFLGDPDLRREAGARGRERTTAMFTAERMAVDTEALLQKLLARE